MNQTLSLNGNWELSDAQSGENFGEVKVPGTVLNSLYEKGRIPDPYYRCNEYEVREVMTKDFLYSREFTVPSVEADEIRLDCECLDTIAEIRLNGEKVATVNDFHRHYQFAVKEYLHVGKNKIEILFKSALNAVREEDRNNDIHYASTGCIHGNAVLRKPHYMFGWAWGPQLPDAGIVKNIGFVFVSGPELQNMYIVQHHQDGAVTLQITPEIDWHGITVDQKRAYCLKLQVSSPDGSRQETDFSVGEEICMEISNPELWWPNGLGSQPLYKVSLELAGPDGEIAGRQENRIGLRTIGVNRDPVIGGEKFCFVVNGVEIFAMGANLIPEDSLLPRVTEERSRKLIDDCRRANFNCIRIWGGGYYPSDALYDACDEAGILVWQDLMFACNVYALTDDFEQNIVAETRDNVQRIRHHACLALWCGNNEMEWGWGDMWERIKGHHPRYKADYTKIFEYILPKVVKANDPVTFWWPSSPSSGGSYDEPNAVNRGDQHYWEVWHSGKPFTEYRKNLFSFCSEYGFQSFPGMKTIRSFSEPGDLNVFSEVMESHQKNPQANGKILQYVSDYFLYPKDLASLSYISQVLQLKAIQYGVEHWRRHRGRCSGSLYWQLNDCWPVASWASIDYYGRWKALHYGAKRFYSPVMISACEKEELSTQIAFFGHNDSREDVDGVVSVALIDRNFRVLHEEYSDVCLPALSAVLLTEAEFDPEISGEGDRREFFARCRLIRNGEVVSESTTLFVKPKHFHYKKPSYKIWVSETENDFEIRVQSDCFAQYVEIDLEHADVIFSDNYFDITDEAGHTVKISKKEYPDLTKEQIEQDLSIRSVADTYDL